MLFVGRLIWDPGNVSHVARHEVVPEEVEQVCHAQPLTSKTHLGRLRIIGPTQTGRVLTVILDPEPDADVYYVVTARPASRKERRRYWQARGSEIP